MPKIRVLVVDDSVVIRRLLTDILNSDEEIEVVGVAPNGRIALAKLPQLAPDVVTLDIEMPELDGLGTLPELRKTHRTLPVIMFSTLTERGAVATLDALSRGATDYVAKPANVGSVSAGMQSVKEQLIPKIKALCSRTASPRARGTHGVVGRPLSTALPAKRPLLPPEVVVIGSSTGGPTALATILTALPREFPLPIVVVQHMPPVFTKHLAMRLNAESALDVYEAAPGDVLRPGEVRIAPGDFHLSLRRHAGQVKCVIHQEPPENSCRPAVDVLFRSAAETFGAACVGVVLTGMGQDGLRGARVIVEVGGQVIAQDQATSVVWGMPRAVAEAGLAREIVPVDEVASALTRLTKNEHRLVGAR
jgi:two-component system chemotaxis response regulator CheB